MLQVPYLFQGLFSGCSCSLPVALRFSELAKEALDALEPLNMAQKRMLRSMELDPWDKGQIGNVGRVQILPTWQRM